MLRSSDPYDLSHEVWRKKKKILDSLDLHIVAPSHWMADNARKSSLFKGRDIQVIPNCIDTDLYSPGDRIAACEHLHLDASKRHILFGAMSATTDPNKGLSYLVEALSQLDDTLKKDVDLIVLGTDSSIADLIPGFSTHSLGVLRDERDMVAAYRAADLTVVPSLSENLSCTIMESLSCGTPVVAFNIGGNGDLIVHKSNGYLAKGNDSCDLAKGFIYCLGKPIVFKPQNNARQTILDYFTPKTISNQYRELYNCLI
jgi:glycosyltransferase involved in cell wall biosynthesis